MESLFRDIRFALRSLRRSPGFAAAAIITLALGIGANTTIFTLVRALLLRPPAAVHAPSRLVMLYTSDFSGPRYGASSYPDYEEFAQQTAVLSGLAATTPRPVSLSVGGETSRVLLEMVSANYFDVLGVAPVRGRTFAPEEGSTPGSAPVAVMAHALWRTRFGGDSAIVGSTIRLSGHTFTIIGIAAQGYAGSTLGLETSLWIPLTMQQALQPGSTDLVNRGNRGWFVIGRLAPGVSLEQARAQYDVVAQRLHSAYGDQWTDVRGQSRVITVMPENEARIYPEVRGAVVGFMALLMTVVGLVLLMCCANVANLLLARATRRQREVAIRLAIGAKRPLLVRQLLTESLLLAGAGGVAGVFLAAWTTGLLAAFRPPLPVPVVLDLTLDRTVLLFSVLVAGATGVLFGLAPALRATRPDLVSALKNEPNSLRGARRFGLRDGLVVTQVAVSVVLLAVAGLLVRSLRNAQGADPGFDPDGLALAAVELSVQGYSSDRSEAFYGDLMARVSRLQGIENAALMKNVALGLGGERRGIRVEGYEAQRGEDMEFGANTVSPGYFRTMGIPIVRGREFTDRDRPGAAGVAIVNETFSRRFWPGSDPIGHRLMIGGQPVEIVGVSRDGKYRSLGEEPSPFFYVSQLQDRQPDLTLVVRASDASTALAAVRAEVKAIDPDLPVQTFTMREHLGISLLPQRLGATLLGAFGLLGVTLGAIGLYGVMAFATAQRTREIGIRMALGAGTSDVRLLVLRRGAMITGIGLGIGIVLALAVSQLTSSVLFGVGVADPGTFITVTLVLLAVALVATYLPARRATKVDPVVALRDE